MTKWHCLTCDKKFRDSIEAVDHTCNLRLLKEDKK
jgi:hypothetical protein